MRLNRRDMLLLVGIWGCVALLLVGAIVALRSTQGVPPPAGAPTATPRPVPIYTPVAAEQTARKQYALAEAAAVGWRADARLVSCRGSWEQTAINLVGRPVDWMYRFYSPQSKRLYFVVVTPDGRLTTLQHVRQINQPPPVVPVDGWQLDSPAALADWLNAGGGPFLGSHPGGTVTAQLSVRSQGAQPEWTVVGYDSKTDETLAATVEAVSGGETATPGKQ